MQQRVRRSVARKAAVVVCLALLGVTACHGANVQQGDRDYPRTNPAPTRFLLLHGTIDPALDIDFRIEWSARSSKCRFATSRIEGAYANYTSWSALQVARRGSAF
ncbi:MAG TPA: hypothetical protein VLX90_04475, partial [Steroidobacteraceae bacterium]|nr:hypothetical protein [Steroidobacteraceae bacterium]